MSKEIIEKIGEDIFSESDIIAKHGTTIANAKSIIETGFIFNKTSMVIQRSKNIVGLCTYGWKENRGGDAANVIISVPKTFFMDLFGCDESEYLKWIDKINKDEIEETVIDSVCDFAHEKQDNKTGPFLYPPVLKLTLPKEFVRGAFVYTDNKNYLNFLNNLEEGMNYLEYFDNPKFYNNLSEEEKSIFVEKMRNKMLDSNNKNTQII